MSNIEIKLDFMEMCDELILKDMDKDKRLELALKWLDQKSKDNGTTIYQEIYKAVQKYG